MVRGDGGGSRMALWLTFKSRSPTIPDQEVGRPEGWGRGGGPEVRTEGRAVQRGGEGEVRQERRKASCRTGMDERRVKQISLGGETGDGYGGIGWGGGG